MCSWTPTAGPAQHTAFVRGAGRAAGALDPKRCLPPICLGQAARPPPACSGTLEPEELQAVFQSLGQDVTLKQATALVESVAGRGAECLSFTEFAQMLNSECALLAPARFPPCLLLPRCGWPALPTQLAFFLCWCCCCCCCCHRRQWAAIVCCPAPPPPLLPHRRCAARREQAGRHGAAAAAGGGECAPGLLL